MNRSQHDGHGEPAKDRDGMTVAAWTLSAVTFVVVFFMALAWFDLVVPKAKE